MGLRGDFAYLLRRYWTLAVFQLCHRAPQQTDLCSMMVLPVRSLFLGNVLEWYEFAVYGYLAPRREDWWRSVFTLKLQ